ncbi:hypothetical protein [Porphyromonas gingivicanis]|uniref:hypothetical protein n=1 Tax=Porphyromonas gingivicanis TaxID=266762 RepID=UPI000470D503|nr:hypothetical protein [Porphyromonas gingivicanis]
MNRDIVYWTEHYVRKNSGEDCPRGILSDSLFIVSLCSLFNLLTIVYIVKFYTGCRILQYLPIKSKNEPASWLYAILLILPILVFIYCRYYRGERLDRILNDYEQQSPQRLQLGKIIFWSYEIITWGGFILSYLLFKH